VAVDISANNYFAKDVNAIAALPITMSGWIKIDTGPLDGNSGLLKRFLAGGGSLVKNWNYGLGFSLGTPTDVNVGYGDGTSYKYNLFDVNLALNMWYFLCGVITSTYLYLTVNQTLYSVAKTALTPKSGPDYTCMLGGIEGSQIDGKISEVALWNAQLTTAEINQLYVAFRKGLPLMIQSTKLVAYYPGDDWSGGVVATGSIKDRGPNGNHIDVVGSPKGIGGCLSYPGRVIIV